MTITSVLHVAGLVTGLGLYGLLLSLALRRRAAGGGSAAWLTLATAMLGLMWNAGALLGGGAHGRDLPPLVGALAYAALGLLPAVFIDTALGSGRASSSGARLTRVAAYALAATAAGLHVVAWPTGEGALSTLALRLVGWGFLPFVAAIALLPPARRASAGAVWAAALAAFAASALHLAGHSVEADTWPKAVFGHHASVPLAFAILYQDYRFALADLFLKRALGLVVLVVAVTASSSLLAGSAVPLLPPGAALAMVIAAIATALGYPAVQRASAWVVDRLVLRRPDYRFLAADIAQEILAKHEAAPLLDHVASRAARAVGASSATWSLLPEAPPTSAPILRAESSAEPRALLLVTPVEPPAYRIELTGLAVGRRLMSDEAGFLEAVAHAAARRLDALRLFEERFARSLREEEAAKLAAQAELRALQAQIQPHFLFNALNTIGYLMRAAPERAQATLSRLTTLLRAVLRRSDGAMVTLGQELDLVAAYLDIERARFEEKLRVRIDVPPTLRGTLVPPLILQPLVENAMKHGIAARANGGDLAVRAAVSRDGELLLTVADSGPGGTPDAFAAGRRRGLGLGNLESRLRALHAHRASLEIESRPHLGTIVTIRLPLAENAFGRDPRLAVAVAVRSAAP